MWIFLLNNIKTQWWYQMAQHLCNLRNFLCASHVIFVHHHIMFSLCSSFWYMVNY